MLPSYDLDKIKFATDQPTFERAVGLYENGRVTNFRDEGHGFFAVVLGGQPYHVFVSARHYDQGDCACYLGQNDTLCKHMVAVAIYAVKNGEKLTNEDREQHHQTICSGRLGELSKMELAAVKKSITAATRCIKPYRGPSRIWFAYQSSLSEGCGRLSAIVSDLPVSEQTAKLLIDLSLRLDKKLCTGIDDSDGTVGGFIREVVGLLIEYAKLDSSTIKAFDALLKRKTCFDWEEPLVRIVDEGLKWIDEPKR